MSMVYCHCPLSIFNCPLSTRNPLSNFQCQLLIVYCPLSSLLSNICIVHCLLFIVHSPISNVQCPLFIFHCPLSLFHCILFIIYCPCLIIITPCPLSFDNFPLSTVCSLSNIHIPSCIYQCLLSTYSTISVQRPMSNVLQ